MRYYPYVLSDLLLVYTKKSAIDDLWLKRGECGHQNLVRWVRTLVVKHGLDQPLQNSSISIYQNIFYFILTKLLEHTNHSFVKFIYLWTLVHVTCNAPSLSQTVIMENVEWLISRDCDVTMVLLTRTTAELNHDHILQLLADKPNHLLAYLEELVVREIGGGRETMHLGLFIPR